MLIFGGFPPYFDAIHTCLGTRVDLAQLIKVYAASVAVLEEFEAAFLAQS